MYVWMNQNSCDVLSLDISHLADLTRGWYFLDMYFTIRRASSGVTVLPNCSNVPSWLVGVAMRSSHTVMPWSRTRSINLNFRLKSAGQLHIERSGFPFGMSVGSIYFWDEEIVWNWNSERVNAGRFECFEVEIGNEWGIMISHQRIEFFLGKQFAFKSATPSGWQYRYLRMSSTCYCAPQKLVQTGAG